MRNRKKLWLEFELRILAVIQTLGVILFMDYLLRQLDNVLLAYSISTILFLTITIFLKYFKDLKKRYLNIANLTALLLAIGVTVISIVNFIKSYGSADYEPTIISPYGWLFYVGIITSGLIPLPFLFQRFRQNVLITILVIVSLNFVSLLESVFIYITNPYRDQLPSSWSISNQSNFAYIVIATVLYFTIAFNLAKRAKTNA